MSLKQNIIYLYFKGKHLITSKSQYQYNHGQYLYFADLNLPQAFEVHFSNKQRGESKTQIGSNKLVEIPDEYFWSGALEIYAWVYLHSGTDDGETIYEVKIPLIKRAKPTDEEPLPVQQSAIDKAIAELNNAVDITNENADKTNADKTQVASIKEEVVTLKEEIDSTASAVSQDAQSSRESANASEQSAQNSAESERKALDYSDEAKGYAQSALESKNTATQKAQVASDASAEAKDFRDEAETFKNEAEQAKQNIVDYRNETKGYRDEALTAKDNVQTIKGDVQSLKTQIDDTADNVFENAREAYQSMISADNASLSASESAENASQSANEANQSATNASESANQAEEFKNQSATNVTHYPKVVDGYWYVWDASKNEYVNTNIDARGTKGDKGEDGIHINLPVSDIYIFVDKDGLVKEETYSTGSSFNVFQGDEKIEFECKMPVKQIGTITATVETSDNINWTYRITITHGVVPFVGDKQQFVLVFNIKGKQYARLINLIKIQDGKTGDSGVYIGTDEPTDEDINVWIDSDESAESFVNDVKVNGISVVTDGVANVSVPLRIKDDPSPNGGVISGGDTNTHATGRCSHAEGTSTNASGEYSHTEGAGTTASGRYTHAEGAGNTASADYSHVEGTGTRAEGSASHAEGGGTKASGQASHAEGSGTEASGLAAHAEGGGTLASGTNSHAGGQCTIAQGQYQTAIGAFNVAQGSANSHEDSDYVFIIGNGTSSKAGTVRSNAMTLDWNGNEKIAGSLTLGMDTQNEVTITATELKALKDDYSSALEALGVI